MEPIVNEADATKETKETDTKPELSQKALDLLEGKSNLTPVLREEKLSGTTDGIMVDLIDKEKDIIHWIIILTGLLGILLTIAYRKNITYLIGSFAGATVVMLILSYVGGSDFDYIASAIGIAAMGIVMMGALRKLLMEDMAKRNNMRVAR